MEPDQIRSAYVLYIGAGAVATGGLISLARSLPTIWHGLRAGLRDVRASRNDAAENAVAPRTDRDLPLSFVGIGMIVLLAAITLTPSLRMNILGALLIVVFGFLFVTVSSRLTGEIGSSSNPISGMTVATLLFTCLIFLLIGWTGSAYYVTALSVGAIVCIAASNGGTTSQDLKTGYLLGATPRLQQIAILFGAFASALILGPILMVLNDGATVYVPAATAAPGLTAPAGTQFGSPEKLVGPGKGGGQPRLPFLAENRRHGRTAGEVPGERGRRAGVVRRSRYQRDAETTARRHADHQVQRAQGGAGELHHQGDFEPQFAVGVGAAGA